MAKSSYATGNSLTKKVWEELLFRETEVDSYFMSKFAGKTAENVVHVKTDLEGEKGDKINFGLRMRATGVGVTEGQTLEGNEEAITTYADSVTLARYRHAIRDDGPMSRQRVAFDLNDEMSTALKTWGTEKIDKLCFDALGILSGSSNVPSKIFYPTSSTAISSTTVWATAYNAVTTSSLITPAHLSKLRVWAETGGDRTQVPLRPIKLNGRSYYIVLVHNDVLYDLKQNTNFQQAIREAEVRGSENPLFHGASAIWDNMIVHSHEFVDHGTGSSTTYSKGALLGAQALVWAWGERPSMVERDFDYEEEEGVAWGITAGVKSPQFNSLTFGSIGLVFARTNVSGM